MEAGITQGKRVTESRHSELRFLAGRGKGRTPNASPSCFPSCSLHFSPQLCSRQIPAAGAPGGLQDLPTVLPGRWGPQDTAQPTTQRLSHSTLTLSLDAASPLQLGYAGMDWHSHKNHARPGGRHLQLPQPTPHPYTSTAPSHSSAGSSLEDSTCPKHLEGMRLPRDDAPCPAGQRGGVFIQQLGLQPYQKYPPLPKKTNPKPKQLETHKISQISRSITSLKKSPSGSSITPGQTQIKPDDFVGLNSGIMESWNR